jgi:hypothetical protein
VVGSLTVWPPALMVTSVPPFAIGVTLSASPAGWILTTAGS